MNNISRIFSWVIVAGVAALFNGCDRQSATSTVAIPATTAPSGNAKSSASIPDQSLTVSEYISLGMAAHDRKWVGQDMAAAASTLQALATRSPEQLPRFGSNRSGAVFARMVAADNLEFYRSRSLPLDARFPQSLVYNESLNAILKVYLSARAANKVTGDELVELLGAQLRGVQVQLELVDEFVPTLSKDDPTYPVRMSGLDKMRQGLAGMLSGVITTLTETQVYDVGMRAKLLESCRATFPSIVPKLTATSQQEIMRRLDELAGDDSVRELRSGMVSLRDEVRATTKARE